ncbi:MAG: glycosyltransferase family 4 protein [bacterium]|nr:glycosyltransferase family 4 protein [bacterium]
MIRILIINSTLERSGLTNVIFHICKNIDNSQFELHILTLSPEPANSMWDEFVDIGVNLHSLNISRFKSLINLGAPLKDMVQKIAPNIIHSHSFRGTYFSGKFLSNYNRMVTVHGFIYDNHSVVYGKILGNIFANRELKSFKNAQVRSVVSKSLGDLYGQNMSVIVIENAVPTDVFCKVTKAEKVQIRKKLNLPIDAKIYVLAGDLNKRKDPLLVIQAFVNAELKNAILLVLGKGPLLDSCKKFANHQVRFEGQVSQIDSYYKAANFLISASISEGQGLSVLEGAMCGLKCLVTNLPPHQEIFLNNPEQVSYFKPRDELGLRVLLKEESVDEIYSGEYFSIKNMISLYQNAYLSMVNQ